MVTAFASTGQGQCPRAPTGAEHEQAPPSPWPFPDLVLSWTSSQRVPVGLGPVPGLPRCGPGSQRRSRTGTHRSLGRWAPRRPGSLGRAASCHREAFSASRPRGGPRGSWGHSPREDQAQQGAEQDEDLVEHGRLRPQDGTVEVILWDASCQRSPGPSGAVTAGGERARGRCGPSQAPPPHACGHPPWAVGLPADSSERHLDQTLSQGSVRGPGPCGPFASPLLPRAADFPGSGAGTHDHVLQSVFGQPAVQKHGDEQVPQGRPEYLWRRRVRGPGPAALPLSRPLTHRDDEGERGDHLQDERDSEDLLPDVALGATGGRCGEAQARSGNGGPRQASQEVRERRGLRGEGQAGGGGHSLCS